MVSCRCFKVPGEPERAIDAARTLHRFVENLPAPPLSRRLQLHSGVHSGLVVLRPGSASRGTVEAVGRTTSIAAKLSAAAEPGEILASAGSVGPSRRHFPAAAFRRVSIDGDATVVAVAVTREFETLGGNTLVDRIDQRSFVGRSDVLRDLQVDLDVLGSGKPFRKRLLGPPGQGKSRLGREFRTIAARRGIAVYTGACSSLPAVGPLQPFRQVIADILATGQLAVSPAGPEPALAAVREQLAAGPLVLILDDWQWVDRVSAAALTRIAELPGALGILLMSRDGITNAVPLEGYTDFHLPAMARDESLALVQSRRPDFDPIDASRVYARAGGNPLFTEELCRLEPNLARTILSNGYEPEGSGWLASLIAVRIDQLDTAARTVLETMAVVGLSPPRWLIDRIVGPEIAAAQIPVLLDEDFLVETTELGLTAFKHGLTWEIVYSLVALATRRRLHARIAAELRHSDSAPDVDLDEALAWHLLASGQPEASWPYAESAGDAAVKLGALDRAQRSYRMAIDTLIGFPPQHFDYPRYKALISKYGYVSIFDSDVAQLPVFMAAIAKGAECDDRRAQADAEYWLAYVAHAGGLNRQAIAHCERALALCTAAVDSRFHVQVRATLGQALAVAADYMRAVPLLDEAIKIKRAHRSGHKASAGMAYTLTQRAAVLGDTGAFADARALIDEALELLNDEVHPVEASILAWSAVINAWQGDWLGMHAAATRAADVARRAEAVYIHAISRAFAAYAEWHLGPEEHTGDRLAAAVECMVERGKSLSLSIAFGFLAEVEAARGRRVKVYSATAGAFSRARSGDPLGLPWAARAWAGQVASHAPTRAQIYLDRAYVHARHRTSPHELARCDLATVRLGLVPACDRHRVLDRATGTFARLGMPGLLAEADALRCAG